MSPRRGRGGSSGGPASAARGRARGGKGQGQGKEQAVDLWRAAPALAPPEPIRPSPEPAALLGSLGPPPLYGQTARAEQYFAAVLERAAVLATALAGSVDLLAGDDAE